MAAVGFVSQHQDEPSPEAMWMMVTDAKATLPRIDPATSKVAANWRGLGARGARVAVVLELAGAERVADRFDAALSWSEVQ